MVRENKTILIAIIIGIILVSISIILIFGNKEKKVNATYQNVLEENTEVSKQNNEKIFVDISELEDISNIEEILENTQTDENDEDKNQDNTPKYYVKVNYGAQVVTIYGKDEDNNYTVPVKAMVCSTGEYTPKSGVYKIPNKWRWLGLEGDVYGQYSTQIVGNILFHSVPYLERGNPASLEYWEYDKLGTYASAGCIRLTVADAIWIYNNCEIGTKVEFYSSSEPGPLGKPTAQKISEAPGDLKNWDPTDPDSNNPWKNYKPEEEKDENSSQENEPSTSQGNGTTSGGNSNSGTSGSTTGGNSNLGTGGNSSQEGGTTSGGGSDVETGGTPGETEPTQPEAGGTTEGEETTKPEIGGTTEGEEPTEPETGGTPGETEPTQPETGGTTEGGEQTQPETGGTTEGGEQTQPETGETGGDTNPETIIE